MDGLDAFRQGIAEGGIDGVRAGLIGDDLSIDTPFGPKKLLYADYVASGRALRQVENFVQTQVLPYYSNSHTEASFCGQHMTRLRESARATVARLTGAGADAHVVFTGSGATAGINRIVGLLDLPRLVAQGRKVAVLTGPYEHHSNILPWRESGAEIIEIAEAPDGGVDMAALRAALEAVRGYDLVVGTFSAASNVTGILTDVAAVTRALKAHGALAVWDYACAAPYLPIRMMPTPDCAIDAIVFSPHKFPGGPGASGVMIVRDTMVRRATPTAPGGGTVRFVSGTTHAYSRSVAVREEGGTPNVIGDIRVALAMLVKDALGEDWIKDRDLALADRLRTEWAGLPEIRLLGQRPGADSLPIFSFQVIGRGGQPVHHQLFARMLSDHLGIQVRAGCACAGPYAHRLLAIDDPASERIFDRLSQGHELERPGWIRLNLSYLHSGAQVARILRDVPALAAEAERLAADYAPDPATARFSVRPQAAQPACA